ncbi:ABC-type transport auxiliary lipoprotein family protein [Pseudomarimonas salicorniae]|uniref:ABC-type transport auxiliary lipoprotein family protein n=1 Tax=Pseudomarimonas salicorniae TaxID=2933270 RepID=A0ABT0GJ37_9GAMM|nr:ABC-type transport auxiliary lipoprotein family protein [Lysobacter sp. CAU 1642]MCK7594015.1 ABC-type transport auxiliary lipoprotein family protein [Lysobacter sp. CAU 1642]
MNRPYARPAVRPFRSSLKLAGIALAAGLLAGCGLTPRAPLAVVDVPAQASPMASAEALPLQLLVPEPQASALLDGTRILVRDEAGQLAQLAGVALPDRTPRWLQSQLLRALSGSFAAAAAPGGGIKPDLQLVLRIERFELDYSAGAQARVELHALLLDAASARAVASARFVQDAPVEGGGSAAGAQTLQRAAHAAVFELARWTTTQAAAASERITDTDTAAAPQQDAAKGR